MLCSKCLKKIPEGEEVRKGSSFRWQAGWAGGGDGGEIVCKKCALNNKKWERKLLIIFIALQLFLMVVFIGIMIIKP